MGSGDDEVDDVELDGLPPEAEVAGTHVEVDPPPPLRTVNEAGLIGPLAQLQAAHDIAETAATGSPRSRRGARLIAALLLFAFFGAGLIGLLAWAAQQVLGVL